MLKLKEGNVLLSPMLNRDSSERFSFARRSLEKFMFTLFCLVSCTHSAIAKSVSEPAIQTVNGSLPLTIRRFRFPATQSVGALYLLTEKKKKRLSISGQAAQAQGVVSLPVPGDKIVLYSPNQYALLHPSLLNEVSTDGIDAIKISFMAMDEKEDGLCNSALKYVSHFKSAFRLDVSNSDASDLGIDTIKAMPNLRSFLAVASSVRGGCLKTIARFPHLEEIDFQNCSPFHQAELIHLASLTELTSLDLSNTGLDKKGIDALSGCAKLEILELSKNKNLNDACLPSLLKLKSLRSISLMGTGITSQGVTLLSALKLDTLNLSRSLVSEPGLRVLQNHFPNTKIKLFSDRSYAKENSMISEPFLGHQFK